MSTTFMALAALALLVWLFLRDRAVVLPGEVLYRDTPDAKTLVSHRYRLAGRPDYVTREHEGLVPVEVKSRMLGLRGRAYDGERAQLFAYCLLAEEAFGGKVAFGVLEYPDGRVTLPFGEKERREVIAVLGVMEAAGEAHRSHGQPGRCRGCGFRGQCGEALI